MLDQRKIGELIAELRKSKQMTQEQLAENLGVSNRSVSRWENGRSMPDLSAFPVLAEELGVSVSELLNGEIRKEREEASDAVKLVIALLKEERRQKKRQVGGCFLAGSLCAVLLFLQMQGIISFSQRSGSVVWLLAAGFLIFQAVGFYFNLKEHRYSENEIRVLSEHGKALSMRTAGEMLQFAKKRQKATFPQYKKAFEAIEQLLEEDENVKFSMTADSFAVNEMSGGLWHLGIAVTENRLLMAGEKITGRVMVRYGTESIEKSSINSVAQAGRRIRLEVSDREYLIEGDQLAECFEEFRNALCEKSS